MPDPHFTGEPVIVLHLADGRHTACSDHDYQPDPDTHPTVPRVLCQGCFLWALHRAPTERTRHLS